jgi:hypothetical protein
VRKAIETKEDAIKALDQAYGKLEERGIDSVSDAMDEAQKLMESVMEWLEGS